MDWKNYIENLSGKEVSDYAESCNTSPKYIMGHLRCGRRIPSKQTMQLLAEKTNGRVTYERVAHFYDISLNPPANQAV